MIHYKKTLSTYLFFASTLVGLQPELSHLRCFGTDGEEALYEAFQHEFSESIHLQCFNHVRRNIKAKLQELDLNEEVILGDIFGRQVESQHFDGLVDAENEEEYEKGLQSLCRKWKQYDSNTKGPLHAFTRWFEQYKSSTIKTMLRSKRKQAGLGDPPTSFTTNSSESINALLKNQVEYKRNDVPVYLDKLQDAIDEQERELERAIIDKGKYKFRDRFKNLMKTEEDWFLKMSLTQRQNNIKRIASTSLVPKTKTTKAKCKLSLNTTQPEVRSLPSQAVGKQRDSGGVRRCLFVEQTDVMENQLSISVSDFCDQVVAQEHVLKAIWNKAADLLHGSDLIVQAPGGTGFLVKSYSGPRPHLVTLK